MLVDKEAYLNGAKRRALLGILSGTAIFRGCALPDAMLCSEGFTLCSYASGETVYDRENYTRSLGIVLRGRVMIYKGSRERKVLIGEQEKGGVFGAAALFGSFDKYASTIIAKGRETLIAFCSQELIRKAILDDPAIGINYIAFLSDRIRFLNSRMDIYAGNDPAGRVLTCLGARGGKISDSMQKLSRELDIPRATLYRTVEKLEKENLLIRKDGEIILNENK